MSIKQSMAVMTLLVILLGVGMLAALSYSINQVSHLKDNQILLKEMNVDILMLRRHEKDFLLRNQLTYQEKFNQQITTTQANLQTLENNLAQAGFASQETATLMGILKSYHTKFTELVETAKAVGLDEKSGLQGALRSAVHNIESDLKQYKNDVLLKDMLMLRRREKDFLLRMDLKYLTKFNQDVAIFQQNLQKSTLTNEQKDKVSQLLTTYQTQFKAMVEGYERKGFDSKQGILGDMRNTIHQTDAALASVNQKVSSFLADKISQLENFIYGLAILFILGVVLTSLRQMKRVSSAVKSLSDMINHVAQNYHFSQRFKHNNQDEIQDIGNALNGLLSHMENAVAEANSVMSAIAQGDFKKQITADFKGDLLTLKQGVNSSAQSVAFTMSELEKIMHALYLGEFSARMDPKIAPAFRETVDRAMHQMQTVIGGINQVMHGLNEGHFEEQVTCEAQGELKDMKDTVNDSMLSLAKAMAEITQMAQQQAQGNISVTCTSQFAGQLEDLKNQLNTSGQRLNQVIQKAQEAANIVSGAAAEVTQSSMSLSERVQEQAAALEETSATMEQLSETIHANAEKSHTASQLTTQASQDAEQSSSIMQNTLQAMDQIQESSHKISDIVTLIDSIAFQTNLLALNAAVEAARAGEHGRGFAVVAGEVRSLAQKSADAAKDITHLIDETASRVSQGVALAQKSGQALDKIHHAIVDANTLINEISKASSEQSQGVQQVNQSIHQIDQVTQQNAALVEETSVAAENLNHQAETLKTEMAFFKTRSVSVKQGLLPQKL